MMSKIDSQGWIEPIWDSLQIQRLFLYSTFWIFYSLLDRVQSEDPTWKESGSAFIRSITRLLERLLDYRNVIQGDENRDKRMSCTFNLLVNRLKLSNLFCVTRNVVEFLQKRIQPQRNVFTVHLQVARFAFVRGKFHRSSFYHEIVRRPIVLESQSDRFRSELSQSHRVSGEGIAV